jgi:hypothetical protein
MHKLKGFSPGTTVAEVPEDISPSVLQAEIIQALEDANSRTPVLEVAAEGAELVIKVGVPEKLVDMALTEQAKRVAITAASKLLHRHVRLRVVAAAASSVSRPSPAPGNGPGARSRAADDPVVRRMQEKFGGQIRTVIDHREKR